jgi:hypothetical protein
MDAKYCREQARMCRDAAVAEPSQADRGHLLYMAGEWDKLAAIKDIALRTNDVGEA